MKVYLVGGAVRDLVMGVTPKDRDYVVVGATPQQMLDLGFSQVGASFPVFLHPSTGEEYALARTERKTGVGYHGFEVTFDPSVTLEQDLIRRDLTINAMAMDLQTNEIIDPFGGRGDIKRRMLRHTGEAFAEDPVRVLRVARFAARYGFIVASSTVRLMEKIVPEIDHVPAERVFAEFEKGLMEDQPHLMVDVLDQCRAQRSKRVAPYMRAWLKSSLKQIQPFTPMHVRFALLSSSFSDQDFNECKVPTDLARVSKAVHRNFEQWIGFDMLRKEEVVELFERVRAFSNRALFEQILDVMDMYNLFVLQKPNWRQRVTAQLEAASNIDAATIAATCTGSIKDAIRSARIAAIT